MVPAGQIVNHRIPLKKAGKLPRNLAVSNPSGPGAEVALPWSAGTWRSDVTLSADAWFGRNPGQNWSFPKAPSKDGKTASHPSPILTATGIWSKVGRLRPPGLPEVTAVAPKAASSPSASSFLGCESDP